METEEKLLVILTPAFPANEEDVNWLPSQQIFLGCVRRQFPELKIVVLSFNYPHVNESYKWNGIEVQSLDGVNYRKFRRPLLWRNVWRKLAEINKRNKISAILSFWCNECSLVGHYFGKRHHVKHRTWICGQDARPKNKYVKFIRPSPGELIAKSDFLADEFFKNHGIRPAHIIPNGIDGSIFPPPPKEKDIDLAGAGSLSILKQYKIFVEALSALKKKFPNIRAILCGGGEEETQIKEMSDNLSLETNLTLTGLISPTETRKVMQRAKIFLHPSLYEGFSMACLEALYAGAHVISFIKPMHREIENWHIVKSKEAMLEKATELLNDPKTDYRSVKVFDMNESAASIISLLGLSQ